MKKWLTSKKSWFLDLYVTSPMNCSLHERLFSTNEKQQSNSHFMESISNWFIAWWFPLERTTIACSFGLFRNFGTIGTEFEGLSQLTVDRETSEMSFLKCSQCDTFVTVDEAGHLEGMEEHMREGTLQALVVLDYILIIVMRTAAGVLLGRRREALSLICAPPPPLYCCTRLIIKTQCK